MSVGRDELLLVVNRKIALDLGLKTRRAGRLSCGSLLQIRSYVPRLRGTVWTDLSAQLLKKGPHA